MSIRSAEGDVYRAKDGCKTVINELKDLYEKAKTKTTSTTSKKADGGTKTKSRASANSREVDIVTSYSFLAALLAEKSLELNDLLVRQEQLMKRKLDRSECQCARKEGKDNKK